MHLWYVRFLNWDAGEIQWQIFPTFREANFFAHDLDIESGRIDLYAIDRLEVNENYENLDIPF